MTAPLQKDQIVPSTLKVPLAIIGPLWGLIAIMFGFFTLFATTNADTQARLAGMQRDFSNMAKTSMRIESKVDGTYPRAEAEREMGILRGRIDDHESRLRKVERTQ